MMRVKLFLKRFSTLVIASTILVGCSNGMTSGQSIDGTKITAWAWDPNFNIKALEVAEKVYNKEQDNNIDLEIVENAQDDIVQKLNTVLSSGVNDALPNIVLIEDYRAQSFLISYPDSFFPLTNFIKTDDFASYKIASSSLNGKNYAIPFDSGVAGLYVRKDILEQTGYTIDDITNVTWDDILKVGQAIFKKTGVKLLSTDTNAGTLIRGMLQSSGSWYTRSDGVTPYLENNASLKEAFQTIKMMNESGVFYIHHNWSEMLKAFNTGIVATVPSGNWITPSITAEESQSGNWVVVPWPKQKIGGSVNASNLGGASLYVINKEGKEAAADFLAKTFGSSADFYQEILTQIGAIGTFLPAEETEAYNQKVEYFGGQEIYKDFSDWSKQIPIVNYGKSTYAMEDIVVKALNQYLEGDDLDTVLTDAQKSAENQVKSQ